jgi:hypothetical protein
MTCPHCRHKISIEDLKARLTEDEFRALRGHFHGKKQTPHAGPGRPPRNKPSD